MHRRTFLRNIGTASIGLCALAPHISGLAQATRPTRRVALIGAGWYGKVDVLRLIQVEPIEVVSICDVDRNMLNEAAEIIAGRQRSGKKPRLYTDYRKLLSERDFDIAIIGTPDHWHALIAIQAIEAGAHVYLQKPISTDVIEARAILAAARRHKKVVQIGLQRRSTPHLIEARDTIVREGKLGKVGLVEVFCYTRPRPGRKNPEEAPPEHLDWDMWTGPAPLRPYARGIHPRSWRGYMEYGNGYVGDMGVHMLDMARWMLELPAPTTISSTGGNLVNDWATTNIPDTQSALFDFGKVKMIWQQRSWGVSPNPKYNWAASLYGDKGTLTAGVHGYDFTPVDGEPVHKDVVMELEQFPEDKTEKDLEKHVAPAIRRHMKDFLNCIDNGGTPVSDVEQGCISTISCILANVSMAQGKSLVWDDKNGTLKGEPQADKLLRRPYRAPWKHPEV
jgi:predicted dehydrogenase